MLEFFDFLPPFGWNGFWVSQLFAAFAFGCDLISWQCKARRTVLIFLVFSTFFIGVHFLFLNQLSGAALTFLASIRFLVSIFSVDRRLFFLFFVLAILMGIWTFKSSIDLLSITANLIFTYAAFRPTDRLLRLWMMAGTSVWIVYNVLVFTPLGIFLESVFLLSNVFGFWRFYVRGR